MTSFCVSQSQKEHSFPHFPWAFSMIFTNKQSSKLSEDSIVAREDMRANTI